MPLIDLTYFSGEIYLANLSSVVVAENVNWFINKYEPKFLQNVLGLDLSEAFKAGLAAPAPIEQKWIDLRDGKIFEVDGKKYIWTGFQSSTKESPIANYVYYKYIIDKVNHTVGTGNMMPEVENGSIVSPIKKLTRVWNEMSGQLNGLSKFLDTYSADYPDWESCYAEKSSLFYKVNHFNL